jgi:hypothetical protein
MQGAGDSVENLMLRLRFVYQMFASESMENERGREKVQERDRRVSERERGDKKERWAGWVRRK